MFEGEYQQGLKNGNGKKYSERVELIFEGEYKDDQKCPIGFLKIFT